VVNPAVGAIGFGGMFSVYSYVSPISLNTPKLISRLFLLLALWGIGMVIGGLAAGWLADKNLNKTIVGVLNQLSDRICSRKLSNE
jgi:DHA1 family inner membrane transport protein